MTFPRSIFRVSESVCTSRNPKCAVRPALYLSSAGTISSISTRAWPKSASSTSIWNPSFSYFERVVVIVAKGTYPSDASDFSSGSSAGMPSFCANPCIVLDLVVCRDVSSFVSDSNRKFQLEFSRARPEPGIFFGERMIRCVVINISMLFLA